MANVSLGIDERFLYCYGCAHSAALVDFPGKPSGERPCCFCIRNKERNPKVVNCWYDGSAPVSIPMDCYHSLDMKKQHILWSDSIYKEKEGKNNDTI